MPDRRYLVKNRKLLLALRFADALSWMVAGWHKQKRDWPEPKRILLANIAHIGDVLISTSVLPPLRHAFPDAEIGFLVGSWSRQVLEGHPDVAHIHVFDNWRLNRAPVPIWAKLRRHALSWFAAWRAIRGVGYDVAIDLYFYWPNAIPLLWAAGIPRRIGYQSGGFGPLLSDALPFVDAERHVALAQMALLRSLNIEEAALTTPIMKIAPVGAKERSLFPDGSTPTNYIILHPGTGSPHREWPIAYWIFLARRLIGDGHPIVATGRGPREAAIIEQIAAAVPSALVLCDELSWVEFCHVVAGARLLIGVESTAAHVASAVGTPFVAIYGGTTRKSWWKPLGNGITLTIPLQCSPCLLTKGCATMDCLTQLQPSTVMAACVELLTNYDVDARQSRF